MSPFSESNPVELAPAKKPNPPTSPQNSKAGAGCIVAFCSLFALIGIGVITFLFVVPAVQIMAARSWVAVPCRITSSVVSPHTDSDGTTYSADIVYSYVVAGQSFTSGQYSFGKPIHGKFNGRQNLVNSYPAGSASTCYIDPRIPSNSVLNRGFTPDVWAGLFGLPFLLFGVGGIWAALKGNRNVRAPRARWRPTDAPTSNTGPLVLRATSTPGGRFIGLGLISAFWNGIVGFMAVKMFSEGGFFAIFGVLFFIPFFVIGLFLLWAWLQSGLALGNARPVLTLSSGALRVGESATLQFELRGGFFMPQYLEIILEGREEATFSRGTDTITDKSTFYLQTLTQSSGRSGNCTVSIPTATMHSFEAPHNKILWVLRANGPIARWADIGEEWKITVEPAR